jgi:pimeloyl-ACP methyl ester carboxylesterase
MPVLRANDIDLYYEIAGAGPPLMLIAGLGSDRASWGPVAPALARHFTLIMPDNRGAGQTRTNSPITIAAMASDCAALLDHLDIERADVLGHSMGGLIAMTLAATEPQRINRLALAACSAKTPARAVSVIDTILALREGGASDEHWIRSFFHWLFNPNFFENKNAVDAAIALSIGYAHAQTADNMRRQIDAMRTYDASGLPAMIASQTLLLTGELDLLFSPAEIEAAYAPAPESKLDVIAGAAHSLHWDKPAAFCEAVLRFLGSQ